MPYPCCCGCPCPRPDGFRITLQIGAQPDRVISVPFISGVNNYTRTGANALIFYGPFAVAGARGPYLHEAEAHDFFDCFGESAELFLNTVKKQYNSLYQAWEIIERLSVAYNLSINDAGCSVQATVSIEWGLIYDAINCWTGHTSLNRSRWQTVGLNDGGTFYQGSGCSIVSSNFVASFTAPTVTSSARISCGDSGTFDGIPATPLATAPTAICEGSLGDAVDPITSPCTFVPQNPCTPIFFKDLNAPRSRVFGFNNVQLGFCDRTEQISEEQAFVFPSIFIEKMQFAIYTVGQACQFLSAPQAALPSNGTVDVAPELELEKPNTSKFKLIAALYG